MDELNAILAKMDREGADIPALWRELDTAHKRLDSERIEQEFEANIKGPHRSMPCDVCGKVQCSWPDPDDHTVVDWQGSRKCVLCACWLCAECVPGHSQIALVDFDCVIETSPWVSPYWLEVDEVELQAAEARVMSERDTASDWAEWIELTTKRTKAASKARKMTG